MQEIEFIKTIKEMELIVTSILAFGGTNIDDIFLLVIFFANKDYKTKHIVIGQYIGIIALIGISIIGSFIGLLFDHIYIGLLGLLPVYFGIRDLFGLNKGRKGEREGKLLSHRKRANKTFSVAAVTFSNGGDNLGVYIPLFVTLGMPQKIVMVIIFLIMVAIWCIAAKYLSKHSAIANVIDRFGHIITPIVLILLGIYILYSNGVFRALGISMPR
ncbi:hypothetical protein FRZ67_18725 [Panacibacter ginsenosidivorans]|uniref:Quaternary ammonium transporter n=1 Tax=Panacibacter ginsenosidivorans TaxID=1813871 RepID=A0A5B8VDV5_9BACT|nr:cadmium resistance transporter [Panacibacter ginsenosidivorans]QEC69245.1 hypothetical protein FRZ67_18725 [Panacibacter ginsenosidivorans]